MKRIEYRFLQIILSHVAGDRVTLGLLHWDGEHMRIASSCASPVVRAHPQAEIVERTVQAKLARAARQAAEAPSMCGERTFGRRVRQAMTSAPKP